MADPLYYFGVLVADSEELQDLFHQCRSVADLMEVIEIEELGISLAQLQRFALRHDEPWWPWAGRSEAWKLEFFQQRRGGQGPLALLGDLIGGIGMMVGRQPEPSRRGLA